MTQEEFTAAASKGEIEIQEPNEEVSGNPSPDVSGTSTDQFLPIFMALQYGQKYLTAAPTFVPQTFQDQIQFVYTGGSYYLYVWINNGWRKATFT